MKEYLVEIFQGILYPQKELVCDFCNTALYPSEEESFYVKIYDSRSRLYIEEFLCEECKEEIFPKLEVVNFEDADIGVRETIRSITERPHHGYIATFSSWEEAQLLIENPFLIRLWGEAF